MAKSHLKLVAPTGNIPTVRTPRRGTNAEYRTREHLTENEVEPGKKLSRQLDTMRGGQEVLIERCHRRW